MAEKPRETFDEMDNRIKGEMLAEEIEEGIRCACGVRRGVSSLLFSARRPLLDRSRTEAYDDARDSCSSVSHPCRRAAPSMFRHIMAALIVQTLNAMLRPINGCANRQAKRRGKGVR